MTLSIVVAASLAGAIGKNNQLLWRLPDDLRMFKKLTTGNTVIMGRKTLDSIGRALPNRKNLVVTRNSDFVFDGVETFPSLEACIAAAKDSDSEVFVIGGGEIYRQALPLADKIYLTEVHADIDGDTWFHIPDSSQWHEVSRVHHPADEKHAYSFDFVQLERLSAQK